LAKCAVLEPLRISIKSVLRSTFPARFKMRAPVLAIIGVGLIGGSIGLGVKKRSLAERVLGVGRDADSLQKAMQFGAIDEATLDLAGAVRRADLVVFCTPVDRIAEQIREIALVSRRDAVLTDAGSTKGAIVAAGDAAFADGRFVGGHPLAGSEKKGVEHAHADLFVDRLTVLTPTNVTATHSLKTVTRFWQALGSRVTCMAPAEHDRALALTSHLPHLLASALAGVLPDEWRGMTASGFRDTTRIAAGVPEVWTPIFQQNRAAVLAALTLLEERLHAFRDALTRDEVARIDQLLTQGKRVRDALGS